MKITLIAIFLVSYVSSFVPCPTADKCKGRVVGSRAGAASNAFLNGGGEGVRRDVLRMPTSTPQVPYKVPGE